MTIKKNPTTEKRASTGRLKRGASPIYETSENGHRLQIKEIQYPSGTTTAEKLEMLEARFKEFFQEISREFEQRRRNMDSASKELWELRKQYDAALQLVRAMIPAPSESSQFDDDIPF